MSKTSSATLLALANVETLAVEGGTPVRSCYLSTIHPDNGAPSLLQPCDSRTSSTMIYSCPTQIRGRVYGFLTSNCTTN